MRALFSFDTEDFVTPETDDALKMIADLLMARGIRPSFAMVGDKARALWTRGRRDVIDSLKRHDIQYHANTHMCWPCTTAELARMKWDEGVNFVLETESRGIADVAEIFGQQPVAWIRCGGNWAPQFIYGLNLLGIRGSVPSRCVLPDGRASWYANTLHARYDVYVDSYFRADRTVEGMKKDFLAAFEKFGETSLPITCGAHPCMFATDIFYDLYNQHSRGIYPPKEQWKPSPVVSRREIRRRLDVLDALAEFIMDQPGAETVTHRDVIAAHSRETDWLTLKQICQAAKTMRADLDAVKMPGTTLSPADASGLFSLALTYILKGAAMPKRLPIRRIIGPPEPCPPLKAEHPISAGKLAEGCRQFELEIDIHHRMPAFVKLDRRRIPPASWLDAMAQAVEQFESGAQIRPILRPMPAYPRLQKIMFDKVHVGSSELPPDFDPGFIPRYSRLQTWSMRPAVADWNIKPSNNSRQSE